MRNADRRVTIGGLTKNLLTLVSGTVIAQLFPLFFYPVFARIFTPNDFGLLASITAITSIITVFASGKYEQAILIAKDKKEAMNIMMLSVLLSACICIATVPCLYLFSDYITESLNEPQLDVWIYVCPLLSFFIIIYSCFNEWNVKKAKFSILAVNKITNSSSITLSKFLLGIFKFANGLVYGEFIGRGLSALSCVVHCIIYDRAYIRKVSFHNMRQVMLRYINFPKYILPDYLINTLSGNLVIFFISSYFGSTELGYFSMTNIALSVPSVIIGKAVMDVFRKQASVDFEHKGNCYSIFSKVFKTISLLSLAALVMFIYFLPDLFVFVLGEKWRVSGEFAQLMAPSAAIGFVHIVVSPIWIIAGKLKLRLYWQIGYFCIILASLLIGCEGYNNIKIAVGMYSAGLTLAFAISIYFSWIFSRGQNKKIYVT